MNLLSRVKLPKSNFSIASIYFILVIIFFYKLFLHPDFIVFGTDATDRFSITNYIRNVALEYGSFPLWIPVHFSGLPNIDATHSIQLNLFCFLYYILPLPLAFNLFMYIHFFFAGFFMYLFAKEINLKKEGAFLAGLMFMFSGVLISHLFVGHMAKIVSWSHVPLLLFLTKRGVERRELKPFLIMSIVMGHQFLGGHTQMSFYSTLLIGVFALFALYHFKEKGNTPADWLIKPGLKFLLSIVLAVMIYSVQLLPSYLYTQKYSERSGGTSYEFSTSWSFAPIELPGIVIRDPFGYAWPWTINMAKTERNKDSFAKPFVPYWGPMPQRLTGDYLGVLPFILVIIGITFNRNRYSWFFIISAIVTLLLSLGKYTPLYWLAYKFVFGFSYFRVPSSIFALTVLCFSLLAGKGVDFLLNDDRQFTQKSFKRFMKGISIFTVLLVVFSALLSFLGENYLNLFQVSMDKYRFAAQLASYDSMVMDRFIKIRNGLFIFSALMIISTLIIYFRSIGKVSKQHLSILLFAVIIIDLWGYGYEFIKYTKIDENTFYGNMKAVKIVKEDNKDQKFRLLAIDDRSIQNASINLRSFSYHGIELLNGRHDLAPRYYQQMLNASVKSPKLLSLLNAKYVLLTKNNDLRRFVGSGERFEKQFKLLVTDDTFKLYKNNEYMDRTFIVNRARIVSDDKYVLPYMMRDHFDPTTEVVIEEKPSKPDGMAGKPAKENKTEIELYSPNRILVNADLKADGFLVLADTYYPDWKVYVDGVEGKIYKTDYALRGVYLNRGSHKLEFVYESKTLKMYGSLSGSVLILTLSAIIWIIYREKRALSMS